MTAVLRLLADGGWHSLEEVAEKTQIPIEEIVRHCAVLSEHLLLEYDTQSNKVRLGQRLTGIIEKLKKKEKAEAKWEKRGAGTIIIPAGKLCRFQSVSLYNMTKKDLQFELTFDLKPREICVSEV